MGPSENVG